MKLIQKLYEHVWQLEDVRLRYINKNTEPDDFIQWKKKFKNKTKRNPNYDDLNAFPEVKRDLKMALITEQNYLCGYCCGSISCNENVDNSNIEHIRPKGKPIYAKLSVDYNNLMASCSTSGTHIHCNQAKDNDYCEEKFISPFDKDCADHFKFLPNSGKIAPITEDDIRADYMIKLLKLNDEVLKKARREAYWSSPIPQNDSKEEIENYIIQLKDPNCSIPYCDMLLYFAEKVLNDIKQ